MAMIDILKLNEELEKMIAAQDEEIKRIDEEVEATREAYFGIFMAAMKSYAEVAKAIAPRLSVFCGYYTSYQSKDSYDIVFRGDMLQIMMHTTFGDSYSGCVWGLNRTYDEVSKYGGKEIIDQIAWRYAEDPEFPQWFDNNFKDACMRAISRKAEQANERYQAALNRREGK